MALTTERIKELWDAYRAALPRYLGFAKAIEAEVQKQDEALILQLVDALEAVDGAMPFPVARQVLKVARARLEGMHGIKRGQP